MTILIKGSAFESFVTMWFYELCLSAQFIIFNIKNDGSIKTNSTPICHGASFFDVSIIHYSSVELGNVSLWY